jgi:hypothetical protein
MRPAILPTIRFLSSLGLALFALLLPVYAFVPNLIERALHFGMALPLIFLAPCKTAGRGMRAL